MKRIAVALTGCTLALTFGLAQSVHAQAGPYRILATTKTGGEGGFDYIYADAANRKLYIPRLGQGTSHVSVFNLDTLAPAGEIPDANGHGVAVDTRYEHGFSSSQPVVMWDAKTLAPVKTIDVGGRPDGILGDEYTHRVYILSHTAPNITVLDAKDGAVLGTIDVGGAPEQSVVDGHGHLFVDLEDKGAIAVVDTATMKVTGTYSLAGKGDGCAGLALDARHGILFAACREPQVMVILSANNGTVLTTLPIGKGCDGAVFNPATDETFSSQGDGTLTVIKESSATSFAVEQTLTTPLRAKTITLDPRTGHLFLMTAQFGEAPPPQPGQRYSRAPMVPGTFEILTVGK